MDVMIFFIAADVFLGYMGQLFTISMILTYAKEKNMY